MKKKGKVEKYLKITKWECPKCGSISLSSSPHIFFGLPLTSMKVKGFAKKFYYKCDECGAILYSLEEL